MEEEAVYGNTMLESLANYDRATSSWRTSQRCLTGEWEEFLGTWPRSGMMRNGNAYALPTSVHRIEEKESSLWPTPQKSDDAYLLSLMACERRLTIGKQIMARHVWTLGTGRKECPPRLLEWLMGYPMN